MLTKLVPWTAGVLALVLAGDSRAGDKCTPPRLKAIAQNELGRLRCSAKEATKADVAPACEMDVSSKFTAAYNKPTGCPPAPDASICDGIAATCQRYLRGALPDGSGPSPSKCEAARLKAAGKLASGEIRCHARASVQGVPTCLAKAQAQFSAAFGKVSGCSGDGNVSGVQATIESNCVAAQVTTDSAGAVTGIGSVYPPNFQLINSDSSWRHTWTHIVSGKFSTASYDGLFFYEQSTGYAAFFDTDGQGHVGSTPLQEFPSLGNWTHVVPGWFGRSGFMGLLLYDQTSGSAAFYDSDGQGNLILLRTYTGWRTTWTQIVPGLFAPEGNDGQSYTSLFFYSPSEGYAEIWSTDGAGNIALVWSSGGLRSTWTQIVAADFSPGGDSSPGGASRPTSDLFFYEGSTGHGEMYRVEPTGVIPFPRSTNDNLPVAASVVAGNLGGYGPIPTDPGGRVPFGLLFVQPTGDVSGWNFSPPGVDDSTDPTITDLAMIESISHEASGIGTTTALAVAGNFWSTDPEEHWFQDGPGGGAPTETRSYRVGPGAFTDLLLYDAAAGIGSFYLHEPVPPPPDDLTGYVSTATCRGVHTCILGITSPISSGSVLPGETIGFHVSSRVGPYTIKIYAATAGPGAPSLAEVTGLPANPTAMPVGRTAYEDGAQWPAVATFQIPSSWTSGLYLARVEAGTVRVDLPFVVRPPSPGSQSKILLVISDATYEAYNDWGGRSLYGYPHTNDGASGLIFAFPQTGNFVPYSFRVSFERPHTHPDVWQGREVPFLNWLGLQGVPIEVETSRDLALAPPDPQQYRLLVFVGHNEYWSREMRAHVEAFALAGGNVAFFAGNTSWWQVRLSTDGRTMTCYKNKWFDPDFGVPTDWPLVTVNWWDDPVNQPETSLTGMSYGWVTSCPENPCYAAGCSMVGPYYTGPILFTVVGDPTHWVFAGTGLRSQDQFGQYGPGNSIVQGGTETDHAQLDPNNCVMHSPESFVRLASICYGYPVPDPLCNYLGAVPGEEIATIGLFTPNNGASWVFTAGTTDWVLGLSQNAGNVNVMDQMTLNVLNRLSQ